MRGLIKWLMVVQVYVIAHIAINLGFHIFTHSFLTFFSETCVNVCVYVLD